MSTVQRFPIVEYDDANDEVKRIYDEVVEQMGVPFVPNWFKCQGSNATLLAASWAKVRATLLEGKVPRVLKELILHHVSEKRGCTYCAVAHGMMADSMGGQLCQNADFKLTADLQSEYIPASYQTAVHVVSKCALDPTSTSNDDFEALQRVGFSEEEVHELMAQADLVNMLTTIADIAGVPLDDAFMAT